MTNITSTLWVDNFRYKFQFESGGGNNFYLDNINISVDDASGLGENGEIVNNLVLYPNPANDELNVSFSTNSQENAIVEILDLTGKVNQSQTVQANEGSNLIMMDTSKLASGMYFMKLNVGSGQQTVQFTVK